jgi:hypothetical protein
MLHYFREKPESDTFLCAVHDEINISSSNGYDDVLKECMEDGGLLDVPMRTTVKSGPTWGAIE